MLFLANALVDCLRLRTGNDLLEPWVAAERVPKPTPLQVGQRHVGDGAALHTDRHREQMLDQIHCLFRFARLRIDQREPASEVSLLDRVALKRVDF